jgi:hypothetical protein
MLPTDAALHRLGPCYVRRDALAVLAHLEGNPRVGHVGDIFSLLITIPLVYMACTCVGGWMGVGVGARVLGPV